MKLVFILSIMIIMPNILFAKQSIVQKPKLAIVKFQNNNCPPSIARGVTDILTGKIFEKKHFTILERNRIKLIVKKLDFKEKNSIDVKYATRLGKILKVDKILVGSVTKFTDYTILVRIIDVKSNTVDYAISEKTSNLNDFDLIAQNISEKIIEKYSKKTQPIINDFNYLIHLSPSAVYGIGEYAEGARKGVGITVGFGIEKIYKNLNSLFSVGYYYFNCEDENIDFLSLTPVQLHVGYSFNLLNRFYLNPMLGGGYVFGRVKRDSVENRTDNNYNYELEYLYNPLLSIKCNLEYNISQNYKLILAPSYAIFFEKNRQNKIAAFEIGFAIKI